MSKIKKFIISMLIVPLHGIIKRNTNWYAFGSWKGEYYIDNSRYIFEYISKIDSNAVLIWIGNNKVKSQIIAKNNIKVLEKNSLSSIIALLKCKYMFCSQMHSDDLCDYNVFWGAKIVYLHHGMPVKKWGADSIHGHVLFNNTSGLKRIIRHILGNDIEYQYFATSSNKQIITNLSALDYRGCTVEKNIKSGTPRNDLLINSTDQDKQRFRQMYAKKLGFDPNKKVIVYLPTFRRSGKKTRSFITNITKEDREIIVKLLLDTDSILIEKAHIVEDYTKSDSNKVINDGCIIHADQDVNVQEMLCFADVLISDYSGAFLDYLLLDRPIIHYAYDYEEYKTSDSGLYYDISEFAAGPVVDNVIDLRDALIEAFSNPQKYAERRKLIRQSFMEFEIGRASETIYNMIIRKEIDEDE